jgi:general stress protein 26
MARRIDAETRRLVEELLRAHNILTFATLREDGWPQATTVGYVNDGLTIYIGAAADSQKARNIARCDKVSLTIDHDEPDWNRIQGLSMAARASVVTDPAERQRVGAMMLAKFPQAKAFPPEVLEGTALLRIVPAVISVLDYTKGFGHAELVEV